MVVRDIQEQSKSANLGPNLRDVRNLCSWTVVKNTFDAGDAGVANMLRPGTSGVVLAGCESHVCALQTALGLRTCDHGRRHRKSGLAAMEELWFTEDRAFRQCCSMS